jgi:ribulose-phosphate 3-epimerase
VVKLAASLLGAHPRYLAQAVLDADACEAPYIHIDAMDGHFAPNIAFGPDTVKALRPLTERFFDVHLMLTHPEHYLDAYAAAGADALTIHLEASIHHHRHLKRIKELGCRAGLALNPGTPLSAALELLPEIDLLLIMSVSPGFGGQQFIDSMLSKIEQAKALQEKEGWQYQISVDGGVNLSTIPKIVSAGADIAVCGSALYGAPSVTERAKQLVTAAEETSR